MSLPSKTRWSRRDLLKRSGMVTAAAAITPLSGAANPLLAEPRAASTLPAFKGSYTNNLFTEIGLRPMINARGTFTIISGSESLPEVKQAMLEASHYYVHMDELMDAVGTEIAKHMGAPYAVVSNGCCAAIAIATVACVCGTDPELSTAMPYYKVRSQAILPKYSRNPYDLGIRMSGVEIVEVETEDEMRAKINEKTAMMYVLSGPRAFKEPLSIKSVCAIGKEKNIPVFVDAAAEEPLYPNIHIQAGATFVGYSGGKCMRGPQAAGVLLGPKDLASAAFWNAAPHHNWGRALKVGKEEAMGMLAAVRQWYKRDHDAEQKTWAEWLTYIGDSVKNIPTVTYQVRPPEEDLSNHTSTLTISWDAKTVGINGTQLADMLDKGTPRIVTNGGRNGFTPGMRRPAGNPSRANRMDASHSTLSLTPYMLQPGEYKIVAAEISKHLRNPGPQPAAPVYTGATAQMEGTWNVTINYERGVGHQQLVVNQDGTTLTADQNGEVYKAQMHGAVDANHVTLASIVKVPGYQVPYTFSGLVDGNTYSGELNMGEYWKATFTATKA